MAAAYFRYISTLPLDQRGPTYERFAVKYLAKIFNTTQAWLLEDIPEQLRQDLGLAGPDTGVDGIVQRQDGLYLPFQAKFRSNSNSLASRGGTDLNSAIARFELYRQDNNRPVPGIIISNQTGLAPGSDLNRFHNIRLIFYNEQCSQVGDQVAAELFNLVGVSVNPSQKYQLRQCQLDDLTTIGTDFNLSVSRGRYHRGLFHAVMGYGKSLCLAEWLQRFGLANPYGIIVVVTPKLKLVSQLTRTFQDYWSNFQPVLHIYASSCYHNTNNVTVVHNSTDRDLVQNLPLSRQAVVIVTTYVSYQALLADLRPHQVDLVVFDEVHQAKRLDQSLQEPHHILGFTATPTPAILSQLPVLVRRKLNWAIEQGILVNYRINAFVLRPEVRPNVLASEAESSNSVGSVGLTDPDNDLITKVEAWAGMIIHLVNQGYTKKLLVVCSTKNQAETLASKLRTVLIPDSATNHTTVIHSVTALTPSSRRDRIERNLQQADIGILTSVRIYREGADLPWLDGVVILTAQISEVDVGQTVGRVLRTYPGKEVANVFIPVLAAVSEIDPEQPDTQPNYTHQSNPSFQFLVDFIHKMALQDPDVFNSSTGLEFATATRLQFIFAPRGGRNRTEADQDFNPDQANQDAVDQLTAEELSHQLAVRVFHKAGRCLSTGFAMTLINCVIATILRFTYDRPDQVYQEFKGARIKAQGKVLKPYLGLPGNTVHQSISRIITDDLTEKAKVLTRVQTGRYRADENGLRRLLKGTIPANFPVPLGVTVD